MWQKAVVSRSGKMMSTVCQRILWVSIQDNTELRSLVTQCDAMETQSSEPDILFSLCEVVEFGQT